MDFPLEQDIFPPSGFDMLQVLRGKFLNIFLASLCWDRVLLLRGKLRLPMHWSHYRSLQITKCAVEKSRADAMVRRSTCSASSALTQYSSHSAQQVLLEPHSASAAPSPSPRTSSASQPGVTRNYSVSPHIDRFIHYHGTL